MKTETLNEADRTRCECWTRVMGYHRPVSAFNTGKQSEHRDRRLFTEQRALGSPFAIAHQEAS